MKQRRAPIDMTGSLYQHKRAHHPELMTYSPTGRTSGRGRPPLNNLPEPTHVCPAIGCGKTYGSACGLYQHKRAHHPELINRRTSAAAAHFECPACDKVYTCYGSLYQHKRAHHPELGRLTDDESMSKRQRMEVAENSSAHPVNDELHFECDQCAKECESAQALDEHRVASHPDPLQR